MFLFKSTYVTSNWNKNDHVFLVEELLAAQMPVNRPANQNHKDNEIIGHILSTVFVDDELNELDIKSIKPSDKIHILASSIIYSDGYWRTKEYAESINRTIEGLKDKTLSVSMECRFHDFDFMLEDMNTSERFLVKKSKDTMFLIKKLRRFGGNGVYENYRVGMVLRKIKFVGVGITPKPANPASKVVDYKEVNEGKIMADEANDKVSALEAGNKALSDALASAKNELEKVIKDNEALASEVKTLKDEIEKVKMDKLLSDRQHSFENVGANAAEAQELAQKYLSLSEEQFTGVVEAFKFKYEKTVTASAQVLDKVVEKTDTTVGNMSTASEAKNVVKELSKVLSKFSGE